MHGMGKDNLHHLYILSESDEFIGMRMFSTVYHKNFTCVQGNIFTITLKFFINYSKLISIFSTQLWFYHTLTHTYITESSIFISELLSLKQ